MFRVERREAALFVPPFQPAAAARRRGWERVGRRLCPRFAGVILVEAAKDLFSAMPVSGAPAVRQQRRVVVAETAAERV